MLSLLDGPCKGTFMVKRAPLFLRAVAKPVLLPRERDAEEGQIRTDFGECDVLDQLNDTPADGEQVFVYQLQGKAGSFHIHARGKDGKALSGWYAMGEYKYLPDVDGEQLRDNVKWQAWVIQQYGGSNGNATPG